MTMGVLEMMFVMVIAPGVILVPVALVLIVLKLFSTHRLLTRQVELVGEQTAALKRQTEVLQSMVGAMQAGVGRTPYPGNQGQTG